MDRRYILQLQHIIFGDYLEIIIILQSPLIISKPLVKAMELIHMLSLIAIQGSIIGSTEMVLPMEPFTQDGREFQVQVKAFRA